eukprot:CAMPEP_0178770290 /NCGR_PEP_ID=MMETSP0744-20121128/21308_1 /TAXON_ID=913974 /ORGANISM="Nitzschia punctata, Strain CCMP561" /LENGTH=246 /DNA_ID=CAMNT_0020426647 /DNA_START=166 /DNA_END=903 /DNA_ORIENTATION=+
MSYGLHLNRLKSTIDAAFVPVLISVSLLGSFWCDATAKPALAMTTTETNSRRSSNSVTRIQSQCHCRQVVLDISWGVLPEQHKDQQKVVNCHCRQCRKYHTTAYTSYLVVNEKGHRSEDCGSSGRVSIRRGRDKIGTFRHSCKELGTNVERWYCTECSSKLLSKRQLPQEEEQETTSINITSWFVNLGPLKEETVPVEYTSQWRLQLENETSNLHLEEKCSWMDALPKHAPPRRMPALPNSSSAFW